MDYIRTMTELSTLIKNQSQLETLKKLCIVLYGNVSVFCSPNSTLEDCGEWFKQQPNGEDKSDFFTLLYSNVNEIYENFQDYEYLYQILEDNKSKEVLINILAHRLLRYDYYLLSAFCAGERQYFDPSFMLYKSNGVFVDCGALNGATTLEYSRHVPDFKCAYVYEPMPQMYEICVKNLAVFDSSRIVVRKAAVSDCNGKTYFDPFIEGSSHISEAGSIEVPTIRLDDDILESVDFIKMDIEGAEQVAIDGAQKHIREDRPVLAISVYHLPADLRLIPLMLIRMCPNYKFYLRHHMPNTNETIFYGIPCELDKQVISSNSVCRTELSDLLVDEYMKAQILQKDYLLHILKLLEGTKEAHNFFEQQFNIERESHSFFEQQFNAEKEAHDFYEQQFQAEKEAHDFFEQQFNAEKEAHDFFEQQFNAEKEAHDFFEQQFNAEKEAHDFFEQQFNAEKEAHIFFEQQYKSVFGDNERLEKKAQEREKEIQELENKLRILENENSKLNHKLQLLKKDFWIQKIIRFKKYEV